MTITSLHIRMVWFVVFIFIAGRAAAYDPPDGFRGLQWGTEFSAVKNEMVLIEDDGGMKCYSRKNDKLSVGRAVLASIAYCFYKDKLFVVSIHFSGLTNYVAIKDTLFDKYGPGYQGNQFMKRYLWGLSSPVVILLDYSEVSDKGSVFYKQEEIAGQKKEDEQKMSKDAAKDL